jgi:hypothetical protein
MKKCDLGGTWRMTGNGYDVEGQVPGSVYSFLHVDNAILPDPHVADNEDIYLEISEHDYTFSCTFDWWDEGYRTTLVFEGLDTLCSVYLNGTHVADTDNMHLRYDFDITELVREHNELCVVCHSPTKFIREQDEKAKLFGATDCMQGYPHLRKAHCMMGWDWGPRLPDAGIWRDVYLLQHDHSGRILDARVTQRHEDGRVFLTPIMEFVGEGTPECWLTAPDGSVVTVDGEEIFNAEVKVYSFELTMYGSYFFEYVAKDSSNRKETFSYAIIVPDLTAPVVKVSGSYEKTASVGNTVKIASFTATDNVDGADKLTKTYFVYDPKGNFKMVNGEFTANYAGKYVVYCYVTDAFGNVGLGYYSVEVK